MNHDNDKQYQEFRIDEVRSADNGWELKSVDHVCIFCPNEQCPVPPEPGEVARLYGRGLGYEVRGIVVSGRVYRYMTEAEADAAHDAWKANRLKRLDEELEASRAERDAKIAALPLEFRQRIERFQRALPNWRRDHESYELFVCEEAVKIAKRVLSNKEDPFVAVQQFATDAALQKEVLGKSLEDHSGNTFGAACKLATLFLTSPENVVKQHGALCPMLGCEDYGCWAAYEGKSS